MRTFLPVRQIGVNIGRKGMLDEEIVPLLLRQRHPTFFTRDDDFFARELCHANYCLVYLNVAKRMGKILRVSHTGIAYLQRHQHSGQSVIWR
jgi:hypothetical protein